MIRELGNSVDDLEITVGREPGQRNSELTVTVEHNVGLVSAILINPGIAHAVVDTIRLAVGQHGEIAEMIPFGDPKPHLCEFVIRVV